MWATRQQQETNQVSLSHKLFSYNVCCLFLHRLCCLAGGASLGCLWCLSLTLNDVRDANDAICRQDTSATKQLIYNLPFIAQRTVRAALCGSSTQSCSDLLSHSDIDTILSG